MKDVDELSPDARALLTRAAGGDEPTNDDRARVHAALTAAIAGGAGVVTVVASSSAAASTTAAATSAVATSAAATSAAGAATMSLSAKIACAVIALSAVGGAAVVVAPWEAGEAPAVSEPVAVPVGPAPPVEGARAPYAVPSLDEPSPEVAAPIPPPEPEPEISTARVPRTVEPTVVRPSIRRAAPELAPAIEPEPPAPEPAPASTLAEEVGLLRSAHAALNAGDPNAALARLAEHARRFPSGTMAEERDAARVLALCRAERRDEARTAAARFLRDRPSSPLAARVRASCD